MPQLRDTRSRPDVRETYPATFLLSQFVTIGATQVASWRADVNRLSRFERLPNELKLMIIGRIANPKYILNLALTGPQFCAFITIHEKRIAEDVIKYIIPAELLHLAVATYAATGTSWNIHNGDMALNSNQRLSDSYANSVFQFVEQYRCPEGFTLQAEHPDGLTLCDAFHYGTMHYAIITYARILARDALHNTPKVLAFAPNLSRTVLMRYQKALYIMQLVAELFAWRGGGQTMQMHRAWGMFWYALAPWEVEQVYCAQTLLTCRLFDSLSKVLSTHRMSYHEGQRFVHFHGPMRIVALEEGGDPRTIATAFQNFRRWNPSGFLTWAHCAPGFGMQIALDRISQRLNQSTGDGSLAYSEIDRGPMKHWYCIFITRRLEKYPVPRGSHSFLSCMRCLTLAGYAFWDEVDESRMPTLPIDEMHKMAVAKHENVIRKFIAPHNIVAVAWLRRWEHCTCEEAMRRRLSERLPPSWHPRNEYCFRAVGQILADETESTR
ncbi:hypothetical protein F5B21DRAFT_522073 [Xylaria acuta]|nr:hypothetical protein F5B21DRAFT_522073 [Xylaria acuta]